METKEFDKSKFSLFLKELEWKGNPNVLPPGFLDSLIAFINSNYPKLNAITHFGIGGNIHDFFVQNGISAGLILQEHCAQRPSGSTMTGSRLMKAMGGIKRENGSNIISEPSAKLSKNASSETIWKIVSLIEQTISDFTSGHYDTPPRLVFLMHQWDKQERVLFQLLLTVVEFINEPKHFNGIKNPRIVALTLYL